MTRRKKYIKVRNNVIKIFANGMAAISLFVLCTIEFDSILIQLLAGIICLILFVVNVAISELFN